ncbi:hypothetical protein ACFL1Q_01060 [Patescibacteria group bacterium]
MERELEAKLMSSVVKAHNRREAIAKFIEENTDKLTTEELVEITMMGIDLVVADAVEDIEKTGLRVRTVSLKDNLKKILEISRGNTP